MSGKRAKKQRRLTQAQADLMAKKVESWADEVITPDNVGGIDRLFQAIDKKEGRVVVLKV